VRSNSFIKKVKPSTTLTAYQARSDCPDTSGPRAKRVGRRVAGKKKGKPRHQTNKGMMPRNTPDSRAEHKAQATRRVRKRLQLQGQMYACQPTG
jgi:hypothetical protein